MSGVLSDGTCVVDGVTHHTRKSVTPFDPYVWYSTTCGIRFNTCEPAKVDATICFDIPRKTLICIACTLGVVSE